MESHDSISDWNFHMAAWEQCHLTKDNMIRENGQAIHPVCFVHKMKPWIIFSYEELWALVLGQIISLGVYINTSCGSRVFYQKENHYIILALMPYVGLYGHGGTKRSLMGNWSGVMLKSSYMLVLLCLIGQDFTTPCSRTRWRMESRWCPRLHTAGQNSSHQDVVGTTGADDGDDA